MPLINATAPLFSTSGAYARGNENNQHEADGTYYLGPGKSDSYAVVNLGTRHQVHPRIRLYVQVNNLFDSQYYTAAQLAATGFTSTGSFIARPFPPVEGEYPLANATFFAPGAPRGAWGGIRLRF